MPPGWPEDLAAALNYCWVSLDSSSKPAAVPVVLRGRPPGGDRYPVRRTVLSMVYLDRQRWPGRAGAAQEVMERGSAVCVRRLHTRPWATGVDPRVPRDCRWAASLRSADLSGPESRACCQQG